MIIFSPNLQAGPDSMDGHKELSTLNHSIPKDTVYRFILPLLQEIPLGNKLLIFEYYEQQSVQISINNDKENEAQLPD